MSASFVTDIRGMKERRHKPGRGGECELFSAYQRESDRPAPVSSGRLAPARCA